MKLERKSEIEGDLAGVGTTDCRVVLRQFLQDVESVLTRNLAALFSQVDNLRFVNPREKEF